MKFYEIGQRWGAEGFRDVIQEIDFFYFYFYYF